MSFKSWLLETESSQHQDAPHAAGDFEAPYQSDAHPHHSHGWKKVMCLTGVDYFSSLAYQQSIAALAAGAITLTMFGRETGALAPIATFILVLLTLFGAVPIYSRVAKESPHGEGSVAMLERLLRGWRGKLFVLVLLGFALTDFVITITLSAADATAHMIENPYLHHLLENQNVPVTLVLIALLGAVFLKGFKEAIGIAVGLVAVYLSLNLVVVGTAMWDLAHHPEYLSRWSADLAHIGSPLEVAKGAILLFPALALGLSGFETGVAVMPLVAPQNNLEQRIKNARKLLLSAALIMSFFLLSASFTTALIIPFEEFQKGGEANGRALAFLAHHYFGDTFGTVYDVSTITILWFAGSSAMAALLNLVPRYLPRYGMAPEWARASRPLALVFTLVAFLVTLIFKADVDAQGGAYATGVLVLITSASIAATLAARKAKERALSVFFGLIAAVFAYTTAQNVHERPEGIKIASVFILSIVVISVLSRIYRTTELRVDQFELDPKALEIIERAAKHGALRLIANEPNERDEDEYRLKEREQREDNHIPPDDPVVFVEVTVRDASDFAGKIEVIGEERFGYQILKVSASTIPNAIAALLLHLRDKTGLLPHAYFAWTEGNPLIYVLKYLAFGEGDIAPVTREVLREAEPDPEKRPAIHVGG